METEKFLIVILKLMKCQIHPNTSFNIKEMLFIKLPVYKTVKLDVEAFVCSVHCALLHWDAVVVQFVAVVISSALQMVIFGLIKAGLV